jgi:hypothetical protein
MTNLPVSAKFSLAAAALLGALAVPSAAEAQRAASRAAQRYEFVPAIEHVQSGSPGVSIEVLSSRNDMVTGGDALVRIAHGATWDARTIRVERNGTDVTTSFRRVRSGELLGLVTGLELGDNRLTVRSAPGATDVTELTITNHPAWGPIFAGPHEQPFICTTHLFQLEAGGTLGPALDAHCSVERRVDYVYRTTAGAWSPLADRTQLPSDVASVTVNGTRMPFVVRIETGTANRAIYETAILHDPRTPEPTPWSRSPGWNGRLIYTYGGGCRPGWYHQGTGTAGVLPVAQLALGYAVASSTLNVFANNCSELLSAEVTTAVKERFIEAYGRPLFTLGWGASGGAHQQMGIADNYPGLLDGLVVGLSFPDMTSGTVFKSVDARLLERYFGEVAPGRFTEEQQVAISGFSNRANIPNMSGMARRSDPTADFPDVLPPEMRYDPVTNRTGARATIYDHTVNVYGRDPANGFARRPLDNVGVQYGLGVLNDGVIDVDQFLDLNEGIGGLDIDFRPQAERHVGDPDAISLAYRTGRIISGRGLASVAILDYRNYTDHLPNGDNHMKFHSFSLRERLIRKNGHAINHVFQVTPRGGAFGMDAANGPMAESLAHLDAWLTAVVGDSSGAPLPERVVRHRPAALVDACWTPEGRKIAEEQTYDGPGECNRLFPTYSAPALVAGAPVVDDIVKCQLKPLDRADYAVAFTAAQWTRLGRVFPEGVCDWSRPGVGHQPQIGMWLRATLSDSQP